MEDWSWEKSREEREQGDTMTSHPATPSGLGGGTQGGEWVKRSSAGGLDSRGRGTSY